MTQDIEFLKIMVDTLKDTKESIQEVQKALKDIQDSIEGHSTESIDKLSSKIDQWRDDILIAANTTK